MSVALKAPERPCRRCGGAIPAQPSGPGRPRVFCSRDCRRAYYYEQEQAAVEAQRDAETEARRYEYERYHYGKRAADQMARDRARNREGRTSGRC
jgi:hypothetical protein